MTDKDQMPDVIYANHGLEEALERTDLPRFQDCQQTSDSYKIITAARELLRLKGKSE